MGRNGGPRLGNLGAFSFSPSLWRRPLQGLWLFLAALHCWNIPRLALWHPVTVQCFFVVLFFLFPFLSKLNLKHVIDHVLSEQDSCHTMLEHMENTAIPPRRVPCKTCACAHPLLSEAMELVLTLGDWYNGCIVTDRGTKECRDKKKEGKTIKDRKKGVTFYPCLWNGCKFTRWILKRRIKGSPKAKTIWLRTLLGKRD